MKNLFLTPHPRLSWITSSHKHEGSDSVIPVQAEQYFMQWQVTGATCGKAEDDRIGPKVSVVTNFFLEAE